MNKYMRNKRSTENLESKHKNNEQMKKYMKLKRSTENLQCKQKKNQYMKEYMKRKRSESKNQPLQSLISKFHDIVSQGHLYICTCCDQLWYKHSITPAATLKKSIPDIEKKTFK